MHAKALYTLSFYVPQDTEEKKKCRGFPQNLQLGTMGMFVVHEELDHKCFVHHKCFLHTRHDVVGSPNTYMA